MGRRSNIGGAWHGGIGGKIPLVQAWLIDHGRTRANHFAGQMISNRRHFTIISIGFLEKYRRREESKAIINVTITGVRSLRHMPVMIAVSERYKWHASTKEYSMPTSGENKRHKVLIRALTTIDNSGDKQNSWYCALLITPHRRRLFRKNSVGCDGEHCLSLLLMVEAPNESNPLFRRDLLPAVKTSFPYEQRCMRRRADMALLPRGITVHRNVSSSSWKSRS